MKRFGTMFLGVAFVLVLLLIGQPVYAGGEPGNCAPGYADVIVGPSYVGDVALAETSDGVVIIFRGKCHRLDVSYGRILPGDLQTTTADVLIGAIVPGAGFPGCYSALGGEDLYVTRVKDFWKVSDPLAGLTYITADVTAGTYLYCQSTKPKKK